MYIISLSHTHTHEIWITGIIIILYQQKEHIVVIFTEGVNRAKVKAKDVVDGNTVHSVYTRVRVLWTRKWVKPRIKSTSCRENDGVEDVVGLDGWWSGGSRGSVPHLPRAKGRGGGNPCQRCIDFYTTTTTTYHYTTTTATDTTTTAPTTTATATTTLPPPAALPRVARRPPLFHIAPTPSPRCVSVQY